MKRELSQKEREEPVNKGYLEDVLESKDYVTKDWAMDMFETLRKSIREEINEDFQRHTQLLIKQNQEYFQYHVNSLQEDFQRHTNSLVEMIRHENKIVSEAIMSRVERIERHVGLETV